MKITAYKDDGVPHMIASEFEAIPEMVEDTPDFINNLKQVQLKPAPATWRRRPSCWRLKGGRTLYAKDLAVDNDIEVRQHRLRRSPR